MLGIEVLTRGPFLFFTRVLNEVTGRLDSVLVSKLFQYYIYQHQIAKFC